jgi:hypothetical protein
MVNHFRGHLNIRGIQAISGYVPAFFKTKLFCWPCLLLTNLRQNIWVSRGYSDLKNLSAAVKKHEASKDHLQNCLSLKRLEKNAPTIGDALEAHGALSIKLYNEEVRKNQILLTYLIDVTVTLAKQELAFRGRDESNNSSTLAILKKYSIF